MPAAAIGSVWASGTWATTWEQFTWADIAGVAGNHNPDLNARLYVYLNAFYGCSPPKDLVPLMTRYLNEQTSGDRTQRVQKLLKDATA